MTTPLSEAGRLYLQDLDVLEEARSELDEYFEAIWDEFTGAVPLPSKPSFEHGGRTWSGYADSGGRCLTFSAPGVAFQLGVCDALMSAAPRAFGVWLQCTKTVKLRIEKTPGALPKVLAAATARGLRLAFEQPESLCDDEVRVRGEDPAESGRALAALLRAFAEHAVALQGPLDALSATTSDEAITT